MSFFKPPAEPKSRLGFYRLLSPSCGLRVSPLCLGAMNFGSAWKAMMGDMDKETAFSILDYYYDQGGNFIDTANNYQDEQSEQWLGEWMQKRGNREEMVIATKFTTNFKRGQLPDGIVVNFTGNSKKSLKVSVEASLKKLQTSYIDLLYVHWWDYTTPVEEVMQALNHLVVSGKVLYLGISDAPAWVVSKANQYARDHGLATFVVYQGKWSIQTRDFERDIIPMTKAEGMGLAPWNALGGGMFKTDAEIEKLQKDGEKGRTPFDGRGYEKTRDIVKALDKIAKAKSASVTSIALAYVLAKTPYVFPIVGSRKVEHIKDSVESLAKVNLTAEDIKELEDASPIDLGFPHNFIATRPQDNMWLNMVAKHQWIAEPQAIPNGLPTQTANLKI